MGHAILLFRKSEGSRNVYVRRRRHEVSQHSERWVIPRRHPLKGSDYGSRPYSLSAAVNRKHGDEYTFVFRRSRIARGRDVLVHGLHPVRLLSGRKCC